MNNQYIDKIQELIKEREIIFSETNSVTEKDTIPADGNYPLVNNQWLKIPDVVCVFVDIRNSTGLSAVTHEKSTASIYEFFTGTAIRMFHLFEAEYIDIKGDGVFALFSSNNVHRALASAVSFRTFAENNFLKLVRDKLPESVDIGFHIGIDQKSVLVKSLGLKDSEGRDRRKNEVWAGKPINMSAKLAALSKDGEIYLSERFYNNLSKNDLVQKSCGCIIGQGQVGEITDVWQSIDKPEGSSFDFEKIYFTKSAWCGIHGKDWCSKIINLDNR